MYFEDIAVGQKLALPPAEVNKAEMVGFAKEYNPAPAHTDESFALTTRAGRLTSSGVYTFLLMWREYVINDFGGEHTLAGTAMRLEFLHPVFAGDVLSGEAYVKDKKARNDYNGLVTVRIDVYNSDKKLVLTCESDTVVKRKKNDSV